MTNDRSQHQPEGTDVPVVYVVGGALAVVLVVTLFAVWMLIEVFRSVTAPMAEVSPEQIWNGEMPPESKALPPAGEALAQVHEHERKLLTRYEWLDEDAGIARIPVDRAIVVLANHPELAGGIPLMKSESNQSNSTNKAQDDQR